MYFDRKKHSFIEITFSKMVSIIDAAYRNLCRLIQNIIIRGLSYIKYSGKVCKFLSSHIFYIFFAKLRIYLKSKICSKLFIKIKTERHFFETIVLWYVSECVYAAIMWCILTIAHEIAMARQTCHSITVKINTKSLLVITENGKQSKIIITSVLKIYCTKTEKLLAEMMGDRDEKTITAVKKNKRIFVWRHLLDYIGKPKAGVDVANSRWHICPAVWGPPNWAAGNRYVHTHLHILVYTFT